MNATQQNAVQERREISDRAKDMISDRAKDRISDKIKDSNRSDELSSTIQKS